MYRPEKNRGGVSEKASPDEKDALANWLASMETCAPIGTDVEQGNHEGASARGMVPGPLESETWEEITAVPLDEPTEAEISLLEWFDSSVVTLPDISEIESTKEAAKVVVVVLDEIPEMPAIETSKQLVSTAVQTEPTFSGDVQRANTSTSLQIGQKSERTHRQEMAVSEDLWTPHRKPIRRRRPTK